MSTSSSSNSNKSSKEMVTWIIDTLYAKNNILRNSQSIKVGSKTAFNMSELLDCPENPSLTKKACSYWGKLLKAGGNKFREQFANGLVDFERGRHQQQLVLSSESTFERNSLKLLMMKLVENSKILQEVRQCGLVYKIIFTVTSLILFLISKTIG